MKKLIKKILGVLGYDIIAIDYNNDRDALDEQKKLITSDNPVIFDVGAHHGQTALSYNKLFKNASVYSFEPFGSSYQILQEKVNGISSIRTFNIALGNQDGTVEFHVNKFSATNSIFATDNNSSSVWGEGKLETQETIKVEAMTIDSFVEKNKIKKIDILKMDTQGSEYLVMEGAQHTIKRGMIHVVYTEIITMPTYENQKELHEILSIFDSLNFRLHSFYNLSLTPEGQLRQLDAIFVRN